MNTPEGLEGRIRKIGEELHRLVGGAVPSLFDRGRWKGRLMEWAMKDEASKIQLFRLIDVLPGLKSDALVVRMLDEYLGHLDDAPSFVFRGLSRVSRRIALPRITAKVVRSSVESFGSQFIAGTGAEDVAGPLRRLRDEGIAATLDVLGEAVLSESEARQYKDRYVDLLTALAPKVAAWPENPVLDRDDKGPIPKLEVSLKISSFNAQLDPVDWKGSIKGTTAGISPVLQTAKRLGIGVTIDMENYYLKDITIAIFKRILEEHLDLPRAGVVLQAYLKDTRRDLLDLIDWLGRRNLPRISLRLVKGAYWDYETVMSRQRGWPCPVLEHKDATDRSFEDLTRLLLEHPDLFDAAIATHNMRSISHAAAYADSLRLPKGALEFQVIFGMAEPIRKALQQMGYRVRVYMPVGELLPGMAYLIRRLLENTSNESFLRKTYHEQTSFDDLIRAPKLADHPASEPPGPRDGGHGGLPSPLPMGTGFPAGPSRPEGRIDSSRDFRNEPLLDFSRSENRTGMEEALARVRSGMGKRLPLVIGADEVLREDEIVSVNPARPEEVVGRASRASIDDADKAVVLAKAAWTTWRKTAPAERAEYLLAAAAWMSRQRMDLAALEVFEVGKTWQEADADVTEAIDFLKYYAEEMIRLGNPVMLGDLPGEENLYIAEPKGVGVVISPWNFPLAIPTGMVSAAVVAGNCVIFKPSSLSPVCGWKLVEAFRSVGLPPGVLQVLFGGGEEIGEHLVRHAEVHFAVFTGSRDVGQRIIRHATDFHPDQRHLKTVIAEMGGKNAVIVDETADLDEAVKGVVQSAFGFQGQKCSACSRVILVGEVYTDFCRRLSEAAGTLKIGPPEDPANAMGPVVDEIALRRIERYIELGKAEGTPLLVRHVKSDSGYFIGPALFTDVAPDSALAREEIFGPVLVIFRADDMDRALELANSTPYALTGGIFSRSPGNIRKAREEMRVGNLYINRKITGALVGRQPFGGFGMSGTGPKAGGPDYLRQFMHFRSVSENTMRRGFAPQVQR